HLAGCKFADLAAGGSIYILILIAGLQLRTRVVNMIEDLPWNIAKFLHGAPIGK
ncbi:hypothetical protein HD554DRAFT_2024127, partial [Boletus coccyginus]